MAGCKAVITFHQPQIGTCINTLHGFYLVPFKVHYREKYSKYGSPKNKRQVPFYQFYQGCVPNHLFIFYLGAIYGY
jgi:hypothetical protein